MAKIGLGLSINYAISYVVELLDKENTFLSNIFYVGSLCAGKVTYLVLFYYFIYYSV